MEKVHSRRFGDENVIVPTKTLLGSKPAAGKRTALQTVTNIQRSATNGADMVKARAVAQAARLAANHAVPVKGVTKPTVDWDETVPNSDETVEEEEQEEDEDDEEHAVVSDNTMEEGMFAAANDTCAYDLTEPTALNVADIINDSASNPDALFPVWDTMTKQELRSVYNEFKNKPGILDEDDEDTFDVSMVAEYGYDIFRYMRKLEIQMRPNPGYMDAQTEIHWSMRSILIDWIVQVHHRFNLLPETLFLTINYIDRFLSIKTVSLSKFQLVGATALFLAAKYEEINCPSVQELEYMVDHGYSVDEILKAERYMIDLLEFNLGWPGPMSFLRRTSKADDYDLETRTLAKYLLEVTIMDEKFVAAPPSWTAAAAHCLSRRMLGRGSWTRAHVYFSGYTQAQLLPCVDAILECCTDPLQHHKAIYEKYADRKYKKASIFVQEYISRIED